MRTHTSITVMIPTLVSQLCQTHHLSRSGCMMWPATSLTQAYSCVITILVIHLLLNIALIKLMWLWFALAMQVCCQFSKVTSWSSVVRVVVTKAIVVDLSNAVLISIPDDIISSIWVARIQKCGVVCSTCNVLFCHLSHNYDIIFNPMIQWNLP